MNEKKYTILISCIACLLVIVLTLCSVSISHAEENDSDCKKVHEGKWSDINDVIWGGADDGYPVSIPQLKENQINTYPKSASFKFRENKPRNLEASVSVGWSAASDQPVLVFLAPVTEEDQQLLKLPSSFVGSTLGVIMSKDLFCFNLRNATISKHKSEDGIEVSSNDDVDVYMSTLTGVKKTIDSYSCYANWSQNFFGREIDLYANSFSCFTSVSDAVSYLRDGDTSKIAFGKGSKSAQEYNSELAFTSFDMSVHDSNSFDDYYLEFIYKCPDSWLGKNPKLVINQTWDYNVYYFDIKECSAPVSLSGVNEYSLSISDTSVVVYLKDLKCFEELLAHPVLAGTSSLQKKRILGGSDFSESFSLGGVPIKGSASTVVDKSLLTLSCVVYVDGVAGHEYSGSVNLITGENTMASYTPDSEGNYTYNADHKNGGHYYTDVGKDAAGNTTYNYYYYYPDGSKEKVSSDDSKNNTISNTVQEGAIRIDNNPTFTNNNHITIEGDTISNDVNNYVDGKSDSDTNKSFIDKFLGFFEIIENNSFLGVFGKIFGWLPTGVSSLITTALGIVVGIRVFKAFH